MATTTHVLTTMYQTRHLDSLSDPVFNMRTFNQTLDIRDVTVVDTDWGWTPYQWAVKFDV